MKKRISYSVKGSEWRKNLKTFFLLIFITFSVIVLTFVIYKFSRSKSVNKGFLSKEIPVSIGENGSYQADPETLKHNETGIDYYQNNRLKEAKKEFLTAIKKDPNYLPAHNNLGIILNKEGDFKEAEKEFLTVLKINPNYYEAMNNLGVIYNDKNRLDEAESLFKKALSLKPDYLEASLNYAICLEKKGSLTEARKYYEQFLAKSDDFDPRIVFKVRKHLEDLQEE